MLLIIWMYIDSNSHGCTEAASEALCLIWCSVPDACITYGEIKRVFGEVFRVAELMDIYVFYVRSVGEFHEYVEPRSLMHLCRTVLRRTLRENKLWIPEGVSRTGLPKSLQSFLNLGQA
ncbi:hypothetical protein AVEN_133548-1 [Araneus ventricosus]|uniref:SOCS box domain-containing protein n=1 Tax=Araneus ventricosus TaxID=182803 RepID=A0A4Y2WDA9_ARAVE|nr:hypothetical protein AVEN_133548-1 [Araneus ventricosus]